MPQQLTFKLIPHGQQHSDYDWLNIERCGRRVVKVRGLIKDKTLTINSINIFPEFEGHGFARKTIRMFKKSFDTIIADRVRHTAVGFWTGTNRSRFAAQYFRKVKLTGAVTGKNGQRGEL